jgi:uncharacterized protein (DUF697 family)
VSVSKKALPKVIRPTFHVSQATAGGLDMLERPQAPIDPAVPEHSGGLPALQGEVIEPAPAASSASPPAPGVLVDVTRMDAETAALQRRSLANTIVERHATYAAVGGIVPVPIANVAGITAVIVRMVKVLSDLYAVPFERDRARAIVVGMMGGAVPTGLAAVTTSTLYYIVPGSLLIGLAVSSIAAAACTRGIGRIFIEHYESGAMLRDLAVPERT